MGSIYLKKTTILLLWILSTTALCCKEFWPQKCKDVAKGANCTVLTGWCNGKQDKV
jgi:hypothetical protein